MEGRGDCTKLDMGLSKSNLSTSSTAQHTHTEKSSSIPQPTNTEASSSTMNPDHESTSDLCTKRKAGEIEPDTMMDTSLRANHVATSTHHIPQRRPPMKKRFSLDLLSEASAMLAQGFGRSKIQEIVNQKENASAMEQQEREKDPSAVSDKMVVDEAPMAVTQNGASKPSVQLTAEPADALVGKGHNGNTTTEGEGDVTGIMALAEQSVLKTNEQSLQQADESIPARPETDTSVTEASTGIKVDPVTDTYIRKASETDTPVKESTSQNMKVEAIQEDKTASEAAAAEVKESSKETPVNDKKDAPVQPLSETDAAIKESAEPPVENAIKDVPMQPEPPQEESAVKESFDNLEKETPMATDSVVDISVKEPKVTPADVVKNDPPIPTASSEADNSVKESSENDGVGVFKNAMPMEGAPEGDISIKESQTEKINGMKAEAPMQTAPEGDASVKESAENAEVANMKNDTPMEPASVGDISTKESQTAEAQCVKEDTTMQTVFDADSSAKEPSLEAEVNNVKVVPQTSPENGLMEDVPLQTASEMDNSVKKSLADEVKTSSAMLLSNNFSSSELAPEASSDAVQGSATSHQENQKEETAAQPMMDEILKDTKENNGQQESTGDSMVMDDAAQEAEKQNDMPKTSEIIDEETKDELGEPMSTDETVKETKEQSGMALSTDESAKETIQERREPVTSSDLEKTKQESGEPVTTEDSVPETKQENGQLEQNDKAVELTRKEGTENMAIDEAAKDTNEQTDESVEKAKEEINGSPMPTDEIAKETVKETAEEDEPPVASSESSGKETNDAIGEPVTSDEAAKKVEGDKDETMIIDESTKETTASNPTAASGENENENAIEELAAPTSTPPAPSDDMADPSLDAIGVIESSPAGMDVDNIEPHEQAMDNEIEATQTVGENETAGEEQSSQVEKKVPTRKMDPVVLEIRKRIQFGCRDNDLSAAIAAYDEAIEKGIKVEAQSFYNLLNLCDGLERSVHVGTPKGKAAPSDGSNGIPDIDEATRLRFAFRLRDHMKELNLALNEAAYSAIVKLLSKSKEYDQALAILEESEEVQQCKPKLRLYSSLLIAYCEAHRMLDALEIWKKLTQRKLQPTEKEYAALMQCATSTGDAVVFERVLTDLAEDVLVPSKATVSRILEWFELAHSFHTTPLTKRRADETKVREYLEQIHSAEKEAPPSMGPVVNVNAWQLSSACPIDTKSGTLQTGCFKGRQLNPVNISQRAWNEMRDMNEKIVTDGQVEGHNTKFQGGKKGKKRMDFSPEERRQEWERFTNFLGSIGHVDVVIDGANVGCFDKNFAGAPKHIDYNQIDWIVQHFSKMGKKVLLVLHERHFAKHMMPDEFRWLEQKWLNDRTLYKTPRGMNDDWFWLHVAYTHQSLVVTNDEMRDHHFQMLAPRTFLRWKERHHAHFDFGNWITTEDGSRQKKVLLTLPEAYSRRLQRVEDGLVIPLAKRGDSNRFMDGGHVASDDEPEEETYLCIRPRASSSL